MEQLLIGLLLWIDQNSAFEYQTKMGLPEVQQVTQRQLAKIYVGKGDTAQGLLSDVDKEKMYTSLASSLEAVYAADKNIIYIGKKIDPQSPYGRSVMVHELIHFLQKVHNHHASAPCLNALEKDAYNIQEKYMKENKLTPTFNGLTVIMRSICEHYL